LPQNWAEDRERRRKAGVPEEISFKTKPEIALERLRRTCEAGVVGGVGPDGRWPTAEADAPTRQSKDCHHLDAAMVSRKTVTA
jgi:SRSO17 transposase